jgi:DNA-binding MarR family transcriptional regulator
MTPVQHLETPEAKTISLPTLRLKAEFREMPGLRLTTGQAARLIGVDVETASSVLTTLVDRGFLRLTANGYVLA